MDSVARPRLDALTGLRYIAALTVLLAHISANFPDWAVKPYIRPLSFLGMPLFFTLSGFLMMYNYAAGFRERFGRTLRTFYVARFARIYPIYAISLLFCFSFIGNFFHDVANHPKDTERSLRYVFSLTQSWVHKPVFATDHNPRTVCLSYLGVAWSVSTEVFFYLVFPLVVLPIARFVTRLRHVLIGGGVIFAGYLAMDYLIVHSVLPAELIDSRFGHTRAQWLLYLCPYIRFGEFLMGALVGQYFLRVQNRPARPAGWWIGAGLLVCATVLFVIGNYRMKFGQASAGWWYFTSLNILYAPLCVVIIYQLAALPSLAQRLMGCRLMVLLGEMSYCMYLLHPLAQSWYLPRTEGEGPMKDGYIVLYNTAAMILALHFFCLGLYRYLEVPARNAIRNWLDPKPKAVLPVIRPEAPAIRQAA